MSSTRAIGGFLELEPLNSPHAQRLKGTLLNSGRACLEYAVRAASYRKVHLPAYLCQAMVQPLEKVGVDYSFYEVDEQLEIREKPVVAEDELLVFINYFGVKNHYSRALAQEFGERLLLDCSQAYFFQPTGSESVFYSPRKFFGVPDGGILRLSDAVHIRVVPALEADQSHERMTHLLLRAEIGPEESYAAFQENEANFDSLPMRSMSTLTRKLLERAPEEESRAARTRNFLFLHGSLGHMNRLVIDKHDVDGPSYYPLKVDAPGLRSALNASRVFVPLLWPPFESRRGGHTDPDRASEIIPLPVDHRYQKEDMQRIAELVNEYCLN